MPQIRQDIFPAYVLVAPADLGIAVEDLHSSPPTKGAYQLNTARVIVTENRIVIAVDGANGPKPVFSEGYDPSTHYKNPSRSKDSYLTTLSGKTIVFKRDDACGCGSRLRSWNPFRAVYSSKDPTE